jgi:DNA-binding winged helix-turn-helix (wHTH) protein
MTETPAELILHNDTVPAHDEQRSVVPAVAIRDGRFAATRTDREVTQYRGQHTGAVNLNKCRRFAHTEQVTESYWKCGDTASSGDLFQDVTSQLVAVFRARGCALPLAEELGQKVSGEVQARVREVLRRSGRNATWISGVIRLGDLTLDLESHIFWRGDDEVHLTPKEFDLLALMMKNADVLLPHVKLLRSVWGLEYGGELEYLRTIVCSLRKKIEKNPANPEYIVCEPGIGYRFRNPASAAPRFAQTEPRLEPLEGETRTRLQGMAFPGAHYLAPPAVPTSELGGAR